LDVACKSARGFGMGHAKKPLSPRAVSPRVNPRTAQGEQEQEGEEVRKLSFHALMRGLDAPSDL
jgi:hypothetical protein